MAEKKKEATGADEKINVIVNNKVSYMHTFIDGINFGRCPTKFVDYLLIGIEAAGLLATLPIWILPYILGKGVKAIGSTRMHDESGAVYSCPVCDSRMIWYNLGQDREAGTDLSCTECGYYVHANNINLVNK